MAPEKAAKLNRENNRILGCVTIYSVKLHIESTFAGQPPLGARTQWCVGGIIETNKLVKLGAEKDSSGSKLTTVKD